MDAAILDLIETELIFVKEERGRLKDKKTNLERIRNALKSKVASSGSQLVGGTSQPAEKKDGRKRKPKQDPNKPKRPQSAYNLFYQEKAPLFKQENPELAQKDIMSIIGPRWKECTADEKSVFEERAKELKAEFEVKMTAYLSGKDAVTSDLEVSEGVAAGQEEDDDDDSEDEGASKKKNKKVKREK